MQGCNPWSPSSLTGAVVLVERGGCSFVTKAVSAQLAGASAVIVYNHASGGDSLIRMSQDNTNRAVRIPALFMGYNTGLALRQQMAQAAIQLTVSTAPNQRGNYPLVVPDFSGRGPTVFGSMKPDLVAPGVFIMSQGYALSPVSELRHKGYGQASGTSMAAPFVAGAAALVKEAHPQWTKDQVTSAMVNTADFRGIRNPDGSLAGVLDMGSGMLNIERALASTLFLVPHKVDFGSVDQAAGSVEKDILITNTGSSERQLQLSVIQAKTDGNTTLENVSVVPSALVLAEGVSASVKVRADLEAAEGPGFLEGYLIISDGTEQWQAPVFAWLTTHSPAPNVVLIDADLSPEYTDVSAWYTNTMDDLGVDYLYWDTARNLVRVPSALSDNPKPEWVVLFTGDYAGNRQKSQVPLPFSEGDLKLLSRYLNSGGNLLVMGKHAHKVLTASGSDQFLLEDVRVHEQTRDRYGRPQIQVFSHESENSGWNDLILDLRHPSVSLGQSSLSVPNPPDTSPGVPITGSVNWSLQTLKGLLHIDLEIEAEDLTGVDAIYLSRQGVSALGERIPLWSASQASPVESRFLWQARKRLSSEDELLRQHGNLSLQIEATANEITFGLQATVPTLVPDSDNASGALPLHRIETNQQNSRYEEWLYVDDLNHEQPVTVAIRRAGTGPGNNQGAILFASFGLEHINNLGDGATRSKFIAEVMGLAANNETAPTPTLN